VVTLRTGRGRGRDRGHKGPDPTRVAMRRVNDLQAFAEAKSRRVARREPHQPANSLKTQKLKVAERVGFGAGRDVRSTSRQTGRPPEPPPTERQRRKLAERVGFVPGDSASINNLGPFPIPRITTNAQILSVRYKTGTPESSATFSVSNTDPGGPCPPAMLESFRSSLSWPDVANPGLPRPSDASP
jgi:hypothetical protein